MRKKDVIDKTTSFLSKEQFVEPHSTQKKIDNFHHRKFALISRS